MSEYYLPIKIAKRRIHICQLSSETKKNNFEFIAPVDGNNVELFSIPVDGLLISDSGTAYDQQIIAQPYQVDGVINGADDSEIGIDILFGKTGEKNDAPYTENNLHIKRDNDSYIFIAKTTNQLRLKRLNITVTYRDKDDRDFTYSFIIHTPKGSSEDVEIYDAAIDFGSEASQVGFKKRQKNAKGSEAVRIVKVLKEYHQQYPGDRFWQGLLDDATEEKNYLKSYFFANKDHSGYKYGDPPNANGDQTFLKTLLPRATTYTDESANIYSNLYLLPNLKLFELLPQQSWPDNDISFIDPEKNPHGYIGTIPILSQDLIEDYIRLILNNIFYSVLRRLNVNKKERYLNITLLMPNVYAQEKVYRLIKDFYDDFHTIINDERTDDFKNFKGIEVQVMSESDASFFGIRFSAIGSDQAEIQTEKGGNYLIIDAGKGTTDFSIIRQQEDVVIYDSIFRTGLPGSGQTLTYAFMEALNDLLPKDFHLGEFILSTKEYPDILRFMEIMENFKCNHDEFEDVPESAGNNPFDKIVAEKTVLEANDLNQKSSPGDKELYIGDNGNESKGLPKTSKSKPFENLRQLNTFLENNYLSKKCRLPGSNTKLVAKIKDLVNKIEESINQSGIETFSQIVFAGRALKLEALHREIEARFKDRSSSPTNKDFFIYHKDTLKSVCLKGAFNKRFGRVNYNSELIGIPLIIDGNKQLVKQVPVAKKNKLFSFRKAVPNDDEHILDQFFFKGRDFDWVSDLKFKIGAVDYQPEYAEGRDANCNLFYAGDIFLLRWKHSTAPLEGDNLPEYYTEMVKETLFPLAYLNFAKPGHISSQYFSMKKEPREAKDATKEQKEDINATIEVIKDVSDTPFPANETGGGRKKKDDDTDDDILA